MTLTSRRNPLVKQIRQLHHPKGRQEQQVFLLEGTHLVEEACQANHPLQVVCCTPAWKVAHTSLWQVLNDRVDRIEFVSPEVLAVLATTVHPDGVVATAPYGKQRVPSLPAQLTLMLDTIQDPGNLGTIIRTATAAGANGLWVSQDSVDLMHPKVLRASAGQWFRLPMVCVESPGAIVHQARATDMQVIATTPTADLNYWQIDFTRPSLLLLGNEGAGLSKTLLALADLQAQIPLMVGVESLNVAITAALLLYEAKRQQLV